jgi:manganese oxidase
LTTTIEQPLISGGSLRALLSRLCLNIAFNRIPFVASIALISLGAHSAYAQNSPTDFRIAANDNRVPAGILKSGNLNIELEARQGEWFPESDGGPSMKVFVFAERGKTPQMPGPLIRIPEGTTIHARVHNLLAVPIIVHGLNERPGKLEDILQIAPGEIGEATFPAGKPGTYYYWASAGGDTWNGRPYKDDSLLNGAFIVDPVGATVADRVFVIGVWRDKQRPDESLDVPVINGKSWPFTERLEYTAGTDVRWRWINPSSQVHPMHLHGSYYRVDSVGDGESDTAFAPEMRKLVVTQLLPVGGTMTTEWQPERPGRWLFHCHILAHISPDISALRQEAEHSHSSHEDPLQHMSGLVTGITVLPRPGESSRERKLPKPKRRLELVVAKQADAVHTRGYSLIERHKGPKHTSCPGPAIVLTQGEPVSIKVINKLAEPTSVHWHGIELESYYDGVPGWTGDGDRVTPIIQPGKSFTVHFNPPRAGTFIYHTHMKDLSQLSSGLYGPIIVVPPGESFHPEKDNVFIIARTGKRKDGELQLNGSAKPIPQQWEPGVQHRLRFVNISPNNPVNVSLTQNDAPLSWSSFAKDGAALPPQQVANQPAVLVIAPGETYDFLVSIKRQSNVQLTIEIPALKEKVTQNIELKPVVATLKK